MNIQKINNNIIQITFSNYDFIDDPIDFITDTFNNDLIISNILSDANLQFGFETTGYNLFIEGKITEDNNIIMTITKFSLNNKKFYIKRKNKKNYKYENRSIDKVNDNINSNNSGKTFESLYKFIDFDNMYDFLKDLNFISNNLNVTVSKNIYCFKLHNYFYVIFKTKISPNLLKTYLRYYTENNITKHSFKYSSKIIQEHGRLIYKNKFI